MSVLESLVSLGYWEAGLAVGVMQGYAYAAAETCRWLKWDGVEQTLRVVLPDRRADDTADVAVAPGMGLLHCCPAHVC